MASRPCSDCGYREQCDGRGCVKPWKAMSFSDHRASLLLPKPILRSITKVHKSHFYTRNSPKRIPTTYILYGLSTELMTGPRILAIHPPVFSGCWTVSSGFSARLTCTIRSDQCRRGPLKYDPTPSAGSGAIERPPPCSRCRPEARKTR
jgi:hypothetical protein